MIGTEDQPDGTPTWVDPGVPELDRAMDFHGTLLGGRFEVGPVRVRPLHPVLARPT